MPCVFISIKQRVFLRFHEIQEGFSRWIKARTTPLLLGTFADMTRGKSELLAENARFATATGHPSSPNQTTGLQEKGSTSPGASEQDGPNLETGALPCPAGNASSASIVSSSVYSGGANRKRNRESRGSLPRRSL